MKTCIIYICFSDPQKPLLSVFWKHTRISIKRLQDTEHRFGISIGSTEFAGVDQKMADNKIIVTGFSWSCIFSRPLQTIETIAMF